MGRSFEDTNDPLTALMAPPEDETPEERSAREAREAEARRVSNEIDEQIRSERAAAKKKKKPVKVLLLGQSESGKSATLKNFQLTYAPKEWMHERMAWKAVIQLNLVRNVNAILDLIVRSKTTSSAGHNNNSLSLSNGINGANGNGYYHHTDGYLTPNGGTGAEYPDSGVIDPHYASSSLSSSAGVDAYSYAHLKASSSSSSSAAGGAGEAGPSSSSSSAAAAPSSYPRPPHPPLTLSSTQASTQITFTEHHHLLRMRLSPLRQVQKDLEQKLGDAAFEPTARDGGGVAGGTAGTGSGGKHWEFGIRSTNGWKSALDKFRPGSAGNGSGSGGRYYPGGEASGVGGAGGEGGMMMMMTGGSVTTPMALGKRRAGAKESLFSHGSNGSVDGGGDELSPNAITECIAACREDILAIWQDAVVRKAAGVARLRMEEMPGFFLNDADRIARTEYEPTDSDVVRARLRTMGVQSHRFVLESGKAAGQEWLMYDFAGSRSSRAIWASFFDDVDAVLFLAPISCFDETLAEDRLVNRLEDSFLLWRLLCSSKLLARTQLILFLNKCDLLTKKLERGVKVRDSVPSFGERKNESEVVQKYFHQHFKEISRQHSPEPRTFFAFFTSIIDTKATAVTLGLVEEGILRAHLKRADLL